MTDSFAAELAEAWRGVRQPARAGDRWPTHKRKRRGRRRRAARRRAEETP